jgi:hypothetical protein
VLALGAATTAAIALGVPAGIVVEVGLALGVTVTAFHLLSAPRTGPNPFEAALARHVPGRHDPHAAMARKVRVAVTSAAATHRILRPILHEAATIRLRHHGIVLDRDRDAAAHALGDDLWELVRPGRARPGPDVTLWSREDVTAALDRLERL